MNIQALRDTIALARRHEQMTGQLEQRLHAVSIRLHPAVCIAAEQPSEILFGFALRYIEQAPELLEAARDRALQGGLGTALAPLLQLAEDYFLKPPELITGRIGLDELLHEAYFAHRLLEEAEDYSLAALGRPLLTLQVTQANLIAHQLLGEPFANELEQAVELARSHLPTLPASAPGATTAAWQQRPCLAQLSGLDLELLGTATLSGRAG